MAMQDGAEIVEGGRAAVKGEVQLWKMALQLWRAAAQVRAWQRVKGCSTPLSPQQLHLLQVALRTFARSV